MACRRAGSQTFTSEYHTVAQLLFVGHCYVSFIEVQTTRLTLFLLNYT
jgi:hypothetical protein